MNSLKSKISVKLILLLSFVVLAASLFVVVSANAEESTNTESNADFNLVIDKGNKATSTYSLETEVRWHLPFEVAITDSLPLNSEYNVIEQLKGDKNITSIQWVITGSSPNKSLRITLFSEDNQMRSIKCMADYVYLNGLVRDIGDSGSLDADTNNKFILGENEETEFTMSGTVRDGSSASYDSMPGVNVRYYSAATPPAFEEQSTATDASGQYSLTIPAGNCPGKLEFYFNKYYTKKVVNVDVPGTKTENIVLFINNLLVEGVGNEHINYRSIEAYYEGDECLSYGEYDNYYYVFSTEMATNVSFTINNNGVFNAKIIYDETYDFRFEFSLNPKCVEGYEVDKWNIDGTDYYANSSGEFVINPANLLNIYTYYKPVSDNPEVVPANDEIAQTGDSTNAVVGLFMFAVVASATCLYFRKRTQK